MLSLDDPDTDIDLVNYTRMIEKLNNTYLTKEDEIANIDKGIRQLIVRRPLRRQFSSLINPPPVQNLEKLIGEELSQMDDLAAKKLGLDRSKTKKYIRSKVA